MNGHAILSLVASASLLTGCGGSSGSADPVALDLDPPPAAATLACERPQPAPADLDGLAGGEQEALWIADRVNLANCAWQHGVLIAWAKGVVGAFQFMDGSKQRDEI